MKNSKKKENLKDIKNVSTKNVKSNLNETKKVSTKNRKNCVQIKTQTNKLNKLKEQKSDEIKRLKENEKATEWLLKVE